MTPRAWDVLAKMRDNANVDKGELVYAKGAEVGYLGYERVSIRTLNTLIRHMALRAQSNVGDDMERYTIGETGRQMLAERRTETGKGA